ncbi:fungal specific transcription factor domain-containing protein [Colletotrichum graminicola]|nr:fungal specific transcription factor domain-containing protein [Colletotrichum graminicola]
MPGSLIVECAQIARRYINEIKNSESKILVAPQHHQ